MTFTESTVELAALDWLEQVGCAVVNGGDIAPGDPPPNAPAITM
jgi:hypothetical protein